MRSTSMRTWMMRPSGRTLAGSFPQALRPRSAQSFCATCVVALVAPDEQQVRLSSAWLHWHAQPSTRSSGAHLNNHCTSLAIEPALIGDGTSQGS